MAITIDLGSASALTLAQLANATLTVGATNKPIAGGAGSWGATETSPGVFTIPDYGTLQLDGAATKVIFTAAAGVTGALKFIDGVAPGVLKTTTVDLSAATGPITVAAADIPSVITVKGGAGADTVTGGAATTEIYGNGGNDTLDGGANAVTIDGGTGNDSIKGGTLTATYVGGAGNDTIASAVAGVAVTVDGGADNDTIDLSVTTATNNSVVGGAGNDTITAGAGTAVYTIDGGAGDDYIDASNLTSATTITAGLGDDKITIKGGAATVDGGAGNDAITVTGANDVVIAGDGNDTITATNLATVTGGTGADTFKVDGTGALNIVKVTDYKYAENDKLVLNTTTAMMAADGLNGNGVFTSTGASGANSSVTVSSTAADGAYKINVDARHADGTLGVREYWTAKTGTSAATLDGSNSADKLVIDARGATNAVVTGSIKDDIITLNAVQATLTAGVNGGKDTITGFNGTDFAGDVLNLSGYTLNDVQWGATAGGTATIGSSTELTGTGFGTATSAKILVQENGGAVKKVAYAAATGAQTIAVSDADVYMATGAAYDNAFLDASGVVTNGVVVNFQDTDKYRNLGGIVGAANATGYYIGKSNSTVGTSFALQNSAKASEVWGGSKKADVIVLNGTNDAQDVMWFGTADGYDSVIGGFKTGFASTADAVNLYDVANLSTLEFNVGLNDTTKGVRITAASGNVLDLTTADTLSASNSVQLQLKDSTGTVKKVAAAVANTLVAPFSPSTIDGVGADLVIGHAGQTDKVTYGAAQTANLVVNLLDATAYKSIEDVDLTGATGSYNVVVGSGSAASNITLAGATTEVWGGSSYADNIAAGSGVDTFWYGANDGADVVTGFTAGIDKVKFYDKSVAGVAAAYTWDGASFASTTKAADSLNVGAGVRAKTIDILDKDNKAAKVAIASALGAAGNLTYVAGTDIYMGNEIAAVGATLNVSSSDNVVLYLGNGVDATVNDIYFSGVTKIDASTATGQTVLIGSKAEKDTLYGGKNSSAMWGGGSANDTMRGGLGTDQYWFGAGDGADVVDAGVDKKDTIVLYNATSVADVTMTVDAVAGKFVVTAKDGSTLSVTDATGTQLSALDGGLTFQFGVNESAKNYTYDRIAKSFVAK